MVNNLLSDAGLQYPANEDFAVTGNYRLDNITIGGVDISKFQIVRGTGMSASERLMVGNLQNAIADACGARMNVVTSTADEAEYEIVIGKANRAETSKELEESHYSIEQTANKLVMYGNGDGAGAYVMRILIDAINSADKKNSDLNFERVESALFFEPSLAEINIPGSLPSYAGKYDPDFTNYENVLERFYMSVDELPEEISIIPNYDVSSFTSSLKTQIYVATDGDDSNPGTIDKPMATINAALRKIRAGIGGVIWVRGGNYVLSSSVTVTSNQGGTLFAPTIISAYKDEVPVFSTVKSIDTAAFSGGSL